MTASGIAGLALERRTLQAAYATSDSLTRLNPVEADLPPERWFRRADRALSCFTTEELLGVDLPDGGPRTAMVAALQRCLEYVRTAAGPIERVVLALPGELDDAPRRGLRAAIGDRLGEVAFVGQTLAIARAVSAEVQGRFAVLVCGPHDLEAAVFSSLEGQCSRVAFEMVGRFSSRELHRALLRRFVERLPAQAREKLLLEEPDTGIQPLSERIARSTPLIARTPIVAIPVREAGLEGVAVSLGREDVESFFEMNRDRVVTALHRLRLETGGPLDRVVVVGDLGELPHVVRLADEVLGPVDIRPASVIADGAALFRTRTEPAAELPVAAWVPLATFLDREPVWLDPPLGAPATTEDDWERAAQQLIAAGDISAARAYLEDVKTRAERLLDGLRADSPPTPRRHTSLSPAAKSLQQRAETYLTAGRVTEAVALSHKAFAEADSDPDVLLALLDVHRQAARLLGGPDNYQAAVDLLGCALQHRRGDEACLRDLTERHVHHARHLASSGRLEDAIRLLENDALRVASDDQVREIEDMLERLYGTSDAPPPATG